MIALGIDTSSPSGSVGLHASDGSLSALMSVRAGPTHSTRLLPGIEALMRSVGVRAGEVDIIAAASGPGSFTGLRIGMATAKGLALASARPVTGFSTLETIARAAAPWSGAGVVCVVLDAGRGEVYRGLYRISESGPEPMAPEAALPPGEAMAAVTMPALVIGDGLAAHRDAILPLLPPGSVMVPESPPIGLELARRATRLAREAGIDRLPPLVPHYLRVSDAEKSWRG